MIPGTNANKEKKADQAGYGGSGSGTGASAALCGASHAAGAALCTPCKLLHLLELYLLTLPVALLTLPAVHDLTPGRLADTTGTGTGHRNQYDQDSVGGGTSSGNERYHDHAAGKGACTCCVVPKSSYLLSSSSCRIQRLTAPARLHSAELHLTR